MTGIPFQRIHYKIVNLFSLWYPDARVHQLSIKKRIVLYETKTRSSYAVLSGFYSLEILVYQLEDKNVFNYYFLL